jgi:glycosyltransferase involved in cell wall biosynthesis
MRTTGQEAANADGGDTPLEASPSGPTGAPSEVRVEALVSGRLAASSRFRVLQHVEPLGALGVRVSVRPPRISKYASVPGRWSRRRWVGPVAATTLKAGKLAVRLPGVARSWGAQVTWLEREVLPGHLTLEPLLHRPVVLDVDDAIWLLSPGHERTVRAVARRAACVVAGNDFLADWFAQVAPAVERVWTAIDTDRFVPAPPRSGPFVVGWTGSGSSLRYLRRVSGALARFLAQAPDARVMVMADVSDGLPGLPRDRLEFVPWSPAVEATVLQSFDVGLMPLPSGEWAQGKCAFKMLQYMSCAVPSVVSPVGMNAQVLAMADVGMGASSDDQWVEALMTLYRDRDRARALGETGRALVERSFSVSVIAPQLAELMRRYR